MVKQNLFSLEGKIFIITGAIGLMGKQHAHAIALFGGTPILIDIDKKALKEFEKVINDKYKVDTTGYVVDITSESKVQKNCNSILKKYKKIDGLINNAANNPKVEKGNMGLTSRLEYFRIENWNNDISVGLTGAFICSKYYGHAISKNKNGGVILNISSDLGLISPDQRLYEIEGLEMNKQPVKPISYSVIKSGLIGLTKYLATYWPGKIRCNAICPGGIEFGQPKHFLEKIEKLIPVGRMAKIDDYQGAVVFILSDASSYMNGAIIPIDGGRTTW